MSFAEADSYCFCMYLSPQLFILSIHLEQAMAETTMKNHWRGAWPAWWGGNKQNTHCFQFAANSRKRSGGGGATRFESYITCLCSTFKRLCYVLHWFSNQLYNMSCKRVYNNLYMLHTTLLHNRFLSSCITCYIQRYTLVVNCICNMFCWYITFSFTWYISCYICCIVLLRNKGGT